MYLSKRGFVIKKDHIEKRILEEIKEELWAKPLVNENCAFKQNKTDFPVYIDTRNKLYIPKMYGISKFGVPEIKLENYVGQVLDEGKCNFVGKLYDNQVEPVQILLDACENKGGGVLSVNTGGGKTFMCLYALSKLRGKAIVVVKTIPLMHQWVEEIKTFLPNIKVGILQGSKTDTDTKNEEIKSCDIVVAMLQSLSLINYPDSFFEDFRVSVFDEVHNISTTNFSKVMFKLCSRYTIGLSATPQRADGCEYVFKWHIGEVVYTSKTVRDGKKPIIRTLRLTSSEYKEINSINKWTGVKTLQFTSMLSELVNMKNRNRLIVNVIVDLVKEGRKILVLSDRRNHLNSLKEILDNNSTITFTYGLFLGNMKQQDLDSSRAKSVILATYAAFSEGVSEKDLDTLLLITPKKYISEYSNSTKNESGKLQQIVGRIFRKEHVIRSPMIIDLFDNFSLYKAQSATRRLFYKEHFKDATFQSCWLNIDDSVYTKDIKYSKTNEVEPDTKPTKNITEYCILD